MKHNKPILNQHEQEISAAFDRDELLLEDPTPALLAPTGVPAGAP